MDNPVPEQPEPPAQPPAPSEAERNPLMEEAPEIPGYEILDKLGEGAMGSVFKARQISLDRIVAIKTLPPMFAANRSYISRFQHEAKAAAKLNHPGIVQIYEAGQHGTMYYFVMEYIQGQTVGDWLRKEDAIPEELALQVADVVGNALKHAWDRGNIVHRDIKPDNILVAEDGAIKVADLGLAKVVGNEEWSQTMSGMMMGTPQYCAPEQVQGDRGIDCRADIYSLGATLYHMLTGSLPFPDAQGVNAMIKHLTEFIEDPCALNPELSAAAGWLLEKMMVRDPAHRYADWGEVLEDLEYVRAGEMPPSQMPEVGESTVKRSEARSKAAARKGRRPRSRIVTRHGMAAQRVDRSVLKKYQDVPAQAPRRSAVGPVLVTLLVVAGLLGGGAFAWIRYGRDRFFTGSGPEPPRPPAPVENPADKKRIADWPAYASIAERIITLSRHHRYEEALAAVAQWQNTHTDSTYAKEATAHRTRLEQAFRLFGLIRARVPGQLLASIGPGKLAENEEVTRALREADPLDIVPNEAALLVAEGNYEAAEKKLAILKESGAEEPELEQWIQDWQALESNIRVERALAAIKLLVQKESFKDAQQKLNALWKLYGASEVLLTLRNTEAQRIAQAIQDGLNRQAQEQLQAERAVAVREHVVKAEQAAKEGRFWDALNAAQKAIDAGADTPGIRKIAKDSRKAILSQRVFVVGNDAVLPAEDGPKLARELELVWVRILGMWVGRYEVTNEEYRRYAPTHAPEDPQRRATVTDPDQPVIGVSFQDAFAYCKWLNNRYRARLPAGFRFRLPISKEWETFARCGDARTYPWGTAMPPPDGWNYYGEEWRATADPKSIIQGHNDGFLLTCPVTKSGKNKWGLYGVGGNVWEFCAGRNSAGRPAPVLRGASWQYVVSAGQLKISFAPSVPPDQVYLHSGFRVVVAKPIAALRARGALGAKASGQPGAAGGEDRQRARILDEREIRRLLRD